MTNDEFQRASAAAIKEEAEALKDWRIKLFALQTWIEERTTFILTKDAAAHPAVRAAEERLATAKSATEKLLGLPRTPDI